MMLLTFIARIQDTQSKILRARTHRLQLDVMILYLVNAINLIIIE